LPHVLSAAASSCSNYDARVASDLTFRPRVNAGVLGTEAETAAAAAAGGAAEEGAAGGAAAAADAARGKAGKEAVFSRLYQGGRAHEEALAAAQAKAEADALAACTFRPDTAKSRKSARRLGMAAGEGGEGGEGGSPAGAASGDAHLRLYEQARERTERLRQQAAAAAAGSEHSFKPRISLGSRRLTEGMRHAEEGGGGGLGGSDLPRHLLLYEDGLQRQQARAAAESNRGRDITEDDVVNCTFRPAITHVGGGAGRRGSGAGVGLSAVPVHDRLYEHARSRQTALAAVAAGYAPDAADGYFYPAAAGTAAAGGLHSDGSGSPAPAASGSASARSGSAGHPAAAAGAAEAGAVAFPSVRLGFPSPPTTGAAAGAVPRTLSPRQRAVPAAPAAASSAFSSTAGAASGAGGAAPASPKPASDPAEAAAGSPAAAADGVASVSV
jgi:hypothetical protein